jgi:hypothetical protein
LQKSAAVEAMSVEFWLRLLLILFISVISIPGVPSRIARLRIYYTS